MTGGGPGSDDVVAGVVGKPFGLAGEVYVHPDPDIEPPFTEGDVFRTPEGRALTVAGSHTHGGRVIVRFAEVADRPGAESLRGARLLVEREAVEVEEGAYWTADLLGREVLDPDGQLVGVLEAVRDGMAHDYLVVARPDGGELVVPAVEELVEVTEDAVVVRLVEGLGE